MKAESIRALIVDDNPGDALLIQEELKEVQGVTFDTHAVTSIREMSEYFVGSKADIVLLDLSLPDTDGLNTLRRAASIVPGMPIVVFTGCEDEQLGIMAVQEGAQDYLIKGKVDRSLLIRSIRYALERKKAEQLINHMAYHDQLTSLPNRALFLDRVTQAIVQAQRNGEMLAVLFLDLDHFKNINDTLGHAAGDQLLREFAERIASCTRGIDTVARLGGDEFTLLLPEMFKTDDAVVVARKVISVLRNPFRIANQDVYVSASIGISLYPNDGVDADTLITHADAAMYRAKQRGRNTFQFFSSSMNAKASHRMELQNALHRALERKELEIFYQPRIHLKSGRVNGTEALVRWRHPEKGLLLPKSFISIAEESGLIGPIGDFVLREACRQAKIWQESGFGSMRMAVNVAGSQFLGGYLAEAVFETLRDTGLEPQWLELEITESQIIANQGHALSVMRKLVMHGVNFSIDDFGTGYSALSYLRRFPVQALKVDRSFVRHVPDHAGDSAIVKVVINLGETLNLNVVAEGVENLEQLKFLKEHGCDEAQGYLISKPLPARTATVFLRRSRQWNLFKELWKNQSLKSWTQISMPMHSSTKSIESRPEM